MADADDVTNAARDGVPVREVDVRSCEADRGSSENVESENVEPVVYGEFSNHVEKTWFAINQAEELILQLSEKCDLSSLGSNQKAEVTQIFTYLGVIQQSLGAKFASSRTGINESYVNQSSTTCKLFEEDVVDEKLRCGSDDVPATDSNIQIGGVTLEGPALTVPNNYVHMKDKMVAEVDEYFKKEEDPKTRASSATTVTRKSMDTLTAGQTVDSDIINEVMNLIQKRSKNFAGRLPSVVSLPHEVFSFLYNHSIDDALAVFSINAHTMFSSDLVIFPLHHLQAEHWAVAVADLRSDKIISLKYYDSIITRGFQDQKDRANKSLALIKEYLNEAGKRSQIVGNILTREWKLEIADNIPQQDNSIDCGVFILKFADYLACELDLNFGQEHIPYFRKVIAWEIRNGRLLWMPQQAQVASPQAE